MTVRSLLACLAVGPASLAAPADAGAVAARSDPGVVVAAERAFAADAAAHGVAAAFRRAAAPEAIIFAPDPVNLHAAYAGRPPTGQPTVTWWPVYAGLAASGDLGFTTGPYVSDGKRFGYYFTVWRRQPDGSWKWVLDAGPRHAAGSRLGRDTAPVFLPRSRTAGRAPQAAMPEVQALEAELARKAASDAHAAFAAVLADDALVMGSMVEPARGREASLVELGRRPATLALAPLGGGASGAGDLVWTYGDARWTEADHPRRGHAVRIWQRRDRGFVVVVDELLPVAEPPPR